MVSIENAISIFIVCPLAKKDRIDNAEDNRNAAQFFFGRFDSLELERRHFDQIALALRTLDEIQKPRQKAEEAEKERRRKF